MSGVSLARPWLSFELEREMQDALAFLSSRDVSRFTNQSAKAGRTTARCIATLCLSNAERVGMRVNRRAQDRGTINIAVRLNTGLSRTALIEALSIATQARTAAVIDEGVAAPAGPGDYAGLHTDVGEALGAAVYRATLQGVREWKSDSGSIQRG